jgi:LuxR family maltose regulon positive regulatory protein
MTQRIPQVARGVLRVQDGTAGGEIAVGSAAWRDWLDAPTTRSFAFSDPAGSFTARKERRQRGGAYWVAYRRQAGTLRKRYLGKPEELTLDQLRAAATSLASSEAPTAPGTADRSRRPAPVDETVLQTKLHVPAPRDGLVARPRLLERLDAGLRGRLILLAAPAGSGKTTLLSAWQAANDLPLAWVSLDEGDNDPARFWRHVIAGLDALHPGVGTTALTLLRSPEQPPIEATLTALINALAALPRDAALVLDDLHTITNPAIGRGLAFLLDRLPPRLHLVVASRADPPLPLARLRARGELVEIRAADLRFTPEEAATFLTDHHHLPLDTTAVATLAERTEGWAAGLQLAALSLSGQAAPQQASAIAAFAGSARFVADYLVEEVLERQPPATQTFLLETAVLDRLCGQLCDAVAAPVDGRPDGQTMLEELERANLFLVPLDSERRWYRYHHLFAELLRARLRRAMLGREQELHRQARTWFARQGLTDEAIGHALAAGDVEGAADLIETAVPDTMARSEYGALRRWLGGLPPDLVQARPRLCLATAWGLVMDGRVGELAGWLDAIEAAPEAGRLAGEITTLRALSLVLRDAAGSVALSRQALALLPNDQQFVRGAALLNLGNAYWFIGDMAATEAALEEALAISAAMQQGFMLTIAAWTLAQVRETQARLPEAFELYDRVLRLTSDREGRPLPIPGAVRACMHLGGVLYEWGDLEAAERYLDLALDTARQLPENELFWTGLLYLAQVRQARGETDQAEALAAQADEVRRRANQLYSSVLIAAATARLRLGAGTAEATKRGAREYREALAPFGIGDDPAPPPAGFPPYLWEYHQRTLAWLALALERPDATLRHLAGQLAACEQAGRIQNMIETLLLQALAHQALGDTPTAVEELDRALALAEPGRYLRLFVDKGAPLAALLARLIRERRPGRTGGADHASPGYVRRLQAAFETPRRADAAPAARKSTTQAAIDPLTERERAVLRLMAAGRSNQEIAAQLFIAVSTVKSYVNAIFAKLAATSRTQAVAHARAAGLLAE